jgi:hypothetical protein
VGLAQFGPAAQAAADVATLVGDEDQLGILHRVHTDSLTSLPSTVPPAAALALMRLT